MRDFDYTVGNTVLYLLLSLADEKGHIFIDKTTFMPSNQHSNTESLRKLDILMRFCGIIPSNEIEKDGYDFLQNFVRDSISDKRKDKLIKFFMRDGYSNQEDIEYMSEILSNLDSRIDMFKYLFASRKKLYDFGYVLLDADTDFRVYDEKLNPLFLCKVSRDMMFSKKIHSLSEELDKVLVLLMGDYAKQKFYPSQFEESSCHSTDIDDVPF